MIKLLVAFTLLFSQIALGQSAGGYYPFGFITWRAPVIDVAALPSSGNELGDARVSEDSFDIYIWNGSSWQAVGAGGTVTSVTASSPLASSGGTTPNISIASSTGTGAVVLANTPTLITPAISGNSTLTYGGAASFKILSNGGAGTSELDLQAVSTGQDHINFGTAANPIQAQILYSDNSGGFQIYTGGTGTWGSGTLTEQFGISASGNATAYNNLTIDGELTAASTSTATPAVYVSEPSPAASNVPVVGVGTSISTNSSTTWEMLDVSNAPSSDLGGTMAAVIATTNNTSNSAVTHTLEGGKFQIERTITANDTSDTGNVADLSAQGFLTSGSNNYTTSGAWSLMQINATAVGSGTNQATGGYSMLNIASDTGAWNNPKYGIYIGAITNGTSNYGIYDAGTTASTSTTTGEIVDRGGLGVSGAVYLGSTLNAASIGTSASALDNACWNASTGAITGSSASCLTSTREVKEDIESLTDGLSEVMSMNPVAFNYKKEFNPGNLGRQVGFIADEIEKVDPRLATYDHQTGKLHGVNYAQTTAVLTKAIQEQQEEILELKKEINILKEWKR